MIKKKCKFCKKEFDSYESLNRKYCSRECRLKYSQVWNKGLTFEIDSRIKHGMEHPRWVENKVYERQVPVTIRKRVLERDGNMCQICMFNGKINREKLEVHHKIPQSICKNNYMDNLITLCFDCHRFIHKFNLLDGVDTEPKISFEFTNEEINEFVEECHQNMEVLFDGK